MARAFAMGLDTATVLQIFNVEYGYQQGTDVRSAASQANIAPAVFTQVPYQGYYASSYPQYGISATPEGEQGSTAVFGPGTQASHNLGHFQYAGVAAPQFYPGYGAPATFSYPSQAPEGNVNAAAAGTAENNQQA